MGNIDKILLLLCILMLGLFLFRGGECALLQETPLDTPAPCLSFGGVDVNTADTDALCLLPGVGPKTAESIIALRQELGGFACAEELRLVPGIGEKTLKKIIEYEYTED